MLSSPQEQKERFRSASVLIQNNINQATGLYLCFTNTINTPVCTAAHKPDLPERTKAMPPQAFGDDMDVPFISWVPRRVQLGTDAIAPPGALILTPRAPSVLGPLDDQVYWFGGSFSLREYSATIMSGVTYAPTPVERRNQEEEVNRSNREKNPGMIREAGNHWTTPLW